MINSKSKRSNSGYKGIFFNKENGSFRVRITLHKDGNGVEIGSFETLKEAIKQEKVIFNLYFNN